MELTYEIQGAGYTIFNDGKAWIVQTTYIPYPGATVEESAQNHIDQIIAESNMPEPVDEVAELKLALAELAESQEQERLNTQLALAELAESMMGGNV